MKKIIVVTLLLTTSFSVFSQSKTVVTQYNAWLMYFGTHKVSEHWGVHAEAQWRRSDVIEHPQQLLLRTGVNYHFGPKAFATAGYAFIETYPYGELPVAATFPEHRIWQQLQVKNQMGAIEWVSRFRLEQRFSKLPVATSENTFEPGDAVYTNRFRLFNRISVPFIGKTIQDKSLYVTAYDEIMVNFGKNVGLNLLDQNRAYLALGYQFPKVGRVEVGYLNQYIVKSSGVAFENNHTVQVGLFSNLPFYKTKF
ncbi:MAG: DUF2490 domain-containing protein [Saprospiraceae bacterium]|nr:DUF2490 domain-containing protein [Saprospiraceae bacterium]